MNRETLEQAQRKKDLIVSFIMQHKGRDNYVSSKQILRFLSDNGEYVGKYSLSVYIHKLMYERNLPIGYVASRGYYWAVTDEDFELVIEDLYKRIRGHLEHICHLNQFIKKG